jgi:rhamnogalacturonyl hydrolase YesR
MSRLMHRAAVAVVATLSVIAAGVTLTGVAPGAASATSRHPAAARSAAALPTRAQVLASMRKANDYWISTHRKPGDNDWNDAVYLHGDMAAYEDTHVAAYRSYALTWAEKNKFGLADGSTTRNADEQASGQVYLDLYADHPQSSDIAATRASVQSMVDSAPTNDWWWVDALYMGMPVFARLGVIGNHPAYYDKMYALFHSTKAVRNGVGLYDKVAHLWWRDQNHPGVFWSRGNGWAFAAMAEILTVLPSSATGHAEYVATFQQMAAALAKVQRSDGFWNSDLGDPTDFAGPETSGTALFAYGLAWGIRHRLLDQATYQPVLSKAWRALSTVALQSNGLLGYVQPGGGVPAGTKSSYTSDFGVGAFLLAGDQVAKLAK